MLQKGGRAARNTKSSFYREIPSNSFRSKDLCMQHFFKYSLPHSSFSEDKASCSSCSSMKPFCHFFLFSCLSGRAILELGGVDLENQPAFRDCSSIRGHVPWDSSKQVFEQDKIFAEVQNCDTDLGTSPGSQEPEFHSSWSLKPRLPTTFTFIIIRVSPFVGFSTTRVRNSPSLCSRNIPGHLCPAVLCPAGVGVLGVSHEDQGLQTWGFFQLSAEGFICSSQSGWQ